MPRPPPTREGPGAGGDAMLDPAALRGAPCAAAGEDEGLQPKLRGDVVLQVVREQNRWFQEWACQWEHRSLQQMEGYWEAVAAQLRELQADLKGQSAWRTKLLAGKVEGTIAPDLLYARKGMGTGATDESTLASQHTELNGELAAEVRDPDACIPTLSPYPGPPAPQRPHGRGPAALHSSEVPTPGRSCSTPDSESPRNADPGEVAVQPSIVAPRATTRSTRWCSELMPHIRLDDNPHLERLRLKQRKSVPFSGARRKGIGLRLHEKDWFLRLAEGRGFRIFSTMLVCAFTIFIGVEVDNDAALAMERPPGKMPDVYSTINRCFAALFFLELTIRIMAHKARFFVGDEWKWNCFDLLMVVIQLVEEILQGANISTIRVIRVLRLVRTLRVVRVVRVFRNLRMMVCCMFNSMGALVWALVLIFLVMYLFAVVFVQGSAVQLRRDDELAAALQVCNLRGELMEESVLRDNILAHFPNLPRALFTLLLCITGGLDWYNVVQPLMCVAPIYVVFFSVYIIVVVFGVLNVLFAIFVEQALQIRDRDLLIQSEIARTETFLRDMQDLFKEADVDGNDFMTREELYDYLKDQRVMAYMAGHQLDVSDVTAMFELLDVDSSGVIEMKEFLIGTMRLKGSARCLDVMRIFQCLDLLEEQLQRIQDHLGVQHIPSPVKSLLQRRLKPPPEEEEDDVP